MTNLSRECLTRVIIVIRLTRDVIVPRNREDERGRVQRGGGGREGERQGREIARRERET